METRTEDTDPKRDDMPPAQDDLEMVRTPSACIAGTEQELAMFRVECALARILPGLA